MKSEENDLLHVFGESFASFFPQSEEITDMTLRDFSQRMVDFVLEAKRGFKISPGDGNFGIQGKVTKTIIF